MYKEVLQQSENMAVWPAVSFVIFFLFFLCLLLWVMTVDNNFIKYMKEMPGREETPASTGADGETPVQENANQKSFAS